MKNPLHSGKYAPVKMCFHRVWWPPGISYESMRTTVRMYKSHLLPTTRNRLSVWGQGYQTSKRGFSRGSPVSCLLCPISSALEYCENERKHVNHFLRFQAHSGGSVDIFLFSPTPETTVLLHCMESGRVKVACSGEFDSLSWLLRTVALDEVLPLLKDLF